MRLLRQLFALDLRLGGCSVMDDRVVVVDVLVCLSFVLRGRHDYGCGRYVQSSRLNVRATLRPRLGWTWLA